MSATPPLSPQQLALVPHNNAGPNLLIVSWSLAALATIFLGLRIYCKFISHRSLYWDDWVLIAAWVVLVIDDALATYLVMGLGFGKHSWDLSSTFNVDKFALVSATRATFTIAAISWTKTAFAITLLRLTEGWTRRFIWFVIISTNIALGLSGLLFWVQCTPVVKSWKPSTPGKCLSQSFLIEYAIFGGAYSAAMDFTLALLPWKVIWPLQLKRVEKVGIAVAMSMGVLILVNAVDLVMWDITEASVTMIAACIPVLRVLLREVRASNRRCYIIDNPNSTHQNVFSKATSSGGKSIQELDFHADLSIYGSQRPNPLREMNLLP
ncbi:hypothetical protein N431DRAFT_495054 [Stipitochalara longipes BDJ]|nr:hypothetical protein N431DRAFT_495054 [Stipitochalara longipes BDJ]